MTEPQISPLARRLAEENSIDWRVIPGTGPENRVIERDILTYLARIMSGEIDPPALPDASEPPSPGGAVPDLSEVSNLAAASAGMAKEGIDLSSLLGGAAPAVAGLGAPIFGTSTTPDPVMATEVIAAPVSPDLIQTAPLDFQASASDALPSSPLDFTFSDAAVTTDALSLEQLSFGEPADAPVAFEAPVSFGDPVLSDPVTSAPPANLSPSDSMDAEFEIDLDDFDDAPAALEVSAPEVSGPEITVPQADLTAHEEDLVLDVESTSEAPLTIAALDASSEMTDDLVMNDVAGDFASPDLSASYEAFSLESAPAVFESFGAQAVEIEPVQLEPAQLESLDLEPASVTALIAPIEQDDFELDLIDADALPIESAQAPTHQPLEPFTNPTLLESTVMAGGAAAIAAEMLTATPPLEPVDSREAVLPTPAEPISHVVQPLEVSELQPSAAVPSSSVVNGFFQGFAVRRHFDASALTKIQHELTQSLNGREVPLEIFLARAAQRNLHTLGTDDVVTLTRLGDTLEPLNASGLHHSFIEAVQSVARATPGTLQGLLILDASHLGADDLVLPVAGPVLTLNVKGEYGHLALAGHLPASKAADFLGKVAQALEIPVSLVI